MFTRVQLRSYILIGFIGIISGIALGAIYRFLFVRRTSTGPIAHFVVTPPTLPPTYVEPTAIPLPEITSIEQISFHDAAIKTDCQNCTDIIVTGDVLTARSINQKTVTQQNFLWPFENTHSVLSSADLTFINLETPLIEDCPIRITGVLFCGDPRNVQGLTFAGVDVVTFANNHAGNAGKEGVRRTEEILEGAGIAVTGIDDIVVKEVNATRFAFVGFNDVEKYGFVADVVPGRMEADIASASAQADVVIVQFHWGEEYRYQPTQRQQELAHQAIDLGADVVVSNHPHWIQPVEFYNGKLIMYSHGNFVFDQMWSRETREGVVGKYVFQGDKLVGVEFLPIFIENYGQPRWMEGVEKQRLLDILKRESELLKNSNELDI